jgi:hypothetical protein
LAQYVERQLQRRHRATRGAGRWKLKLDGHMSTGGITVARRPAESLDNLVRPLE